MLSSLCSFCGTYSKLSTIQTKIQLLLYHSMQHAAKKQTLCWILLSFKGQQMISNHKSILQCLPTLRWYNSSALPSFSLYRFPMILFPTYIHWVIIMYWKAVAWNHLKLLPICAPTPSVDLFPTSMVLSHEDCHKTSSMTSWHPWSSTRHWMPPL